MERPVRQLVSSGLSLRLSRSCRLFRIRAILLFLNVYFYSYSRIARSTPNTHFPLTSRQAWEKQWQFGWRKKEGR